MPSIVGWATCANADFVMDNVFWVGVYPGLTEAHLDYMIESFHEALVPIAGRR